MKSRKRVWAWLLPAALVYLAGFVAAAFADLAINEALYNPQDTLSIIMECFGWYPVFLPAVLLLLLVGTTPAEGLQPPALRYGFLAAAAVGIGVMFYDSFRHWQARGMVEGFLDWRNLLLFGALALLAVLLALRLRHIRPGTRRRLLFFSLWGTLLLAAEQVVINGLKLLWQRTRFDELVAAGSFDAFTPWYRPLGNGGTSFPSGHTANAACVLMLVVLCDLFPAWGRRRRLVYAICWAYIVLMALARIVIGRHYLSDTLAASAILAGMFWLLRNNKTYRRGIRRLQRARRPARR